MNRSVLVVGKLLSIGLQALLFALLARRFDDAAFGSWLAAFTLAQVLAGLADFGLVTTAQRLVFTWGRSPVLQSVQVLAIASIVVGALAFLTAGALGIGTAGLLAAFPVFVFARLQAPLLVIAAAQGRAVRIALSEVLSRALPIGIVALSPRSNLMFWLGVAMVVGGVVSFAVLFVPKSHAEPETSVAHTPLAGARMVLREGRSFGVLTISSTVHGRNDQMFLARYGFESALPAYNAAYRLFDSVVSLSSASLMTFFKDFQLNARKSGWVERLVATSTAIAVGIAAAIWALAPRATSLLLGRVDSDAVFCARVLAVGAGAGIVNAVVVRLALVRRLDRSMLFLGVALMLTNVFANAVVLQSGGVRAAAITTTAFEFLGLTTMGTLLFVNRGRQEKVDSEGVSIGTTTMVMAS